MKKRKAKQYMFKMFSRFLLLLTLGLIAFSSLAEQEKAVWLSKEYSAPDHYFSELNYSPSRIDFAAVQRALANQQIQGFIPSSGPDLKGGHHLYVKAFRVDTASDWVVDLTVSTYVANFWFTVFDHNGQRVGHFSGGVNSEQKNPYFLRHGRDIHLSAGEYYLVAELISPYFIAEPIPNVLPKEGYQSSIKLTNIITGLGLGIFAGLGMYYLVMSFIRRNSLDLIYSGFIWSNLIFNAAALMVLPDVFNIKWFYFTSVTIAISNILYVIFVMRLLDVRKQNNKYLYYGGLGVMSIMVVLMLDAYFIHPESSNANNNLGVLMFLAYGVVTASVKSINSPNRINARLYLLANVGFVGLGLIATVAPDAGSMPTTYAAHWGIMAVSVEVILLAFLISYQLNQVHLERDEALKQARASLELASTDGLTGIPNRYAMEKYLESNDGDIGFTFIDLDGLKMYNDNHGHSMGDELLRSFALVLNQNIPDDTKLFRIAGDEFALICPPKKLTKAESCIHQTLSTICSIGFSDVGASYGSATLYEQDDRSISDMMKMADIRMYKNKVDKKKAS